MVRVGVRHVPLIVNVRSIGLGMNVSQCNVLISDKNMPVCVCVCEWVSVCVCVCVKGWAHSAQSALPFFTPVGKTPLSKTWLNGCISLSLSLSLSSFLTLSPSPSIADSLSLSLSLSHSLSVSLPCENRPPLRATKSSLLSSQAREPLSPSPSPERRPRDTNRTWHPERGWRWRRKRREEENVLSPLFLPHCLVSLCFFFFPRKAYGCRVVGKRRALT